MKKFGESLEKSKSESMNRVQLGYKKANEAVRLGNADHIAAQGEANDILRTLSYNDSNRFIPLSHFRESERG